MEARSPRGSVRATRGSVEDSARVRDRILNAFSARAKRSGIRAVVMGELASDLRISPMTLYKHFASKHELVSAMVDAWALEVAAIDALDLADVQDPNEVLDRLLAWADAWTDSLSNVSPSFFKDLARDHPECWTRFMTQIDDRKWAAAPSLAPFLRPELNPTAALVMLDDLVTRVADPRQAERLGVSRREAVRTAVAIWGGGAFLQRPKLRPVPSGGTPRR